MSFIDANRDEFGVEPICTVLHSAGVSVAPSTYYAAKARTPSARAQRDALRGPVLMRLWEATTGSTARELATLSWAVLSVLCPPSVVNQVNPTSDQGSLVSRDTRASRRGSAANEINGLD